MRFLLWEIGRKSGGNEEGVRRKRGRSQGERKKARGNQEGARRKPGVNSEGNQWKVSGKSAVQKGSPARNDAFMIPWNCPCFLEESRAGQKELWRSVGVRSGVHLMEQAAQLGSGLGAVAAGGIG